MATMKTGNVTVDAIHIDCPYCGAGFEDPDTGSFMITSDTMACERDVYTCWACKENYKLPSAKATYGLLRPNRAHAVAYNQLGV